MLGFRTILFLVIIYLGAFRGGDDPSGPWPRI